MAKKKKRKNHKKDHSQPMPAVQWRWLSPDEVDALPLPDFGLTTGAERLMEAETAATAAGRKKRARALRSERWVIADPEIRIHVEQDDDEPTLRYFSLRGVLLTTEPSEELITQGTDLDKVPGITLIGRHFAERILKISATQGIVLRSEEIRVYLDSVSSWAGDGIYSQVVHIITTGYLGLDPDDIEVHTTGFDPDREVEPYD